MLSFDLRLARPDDADALFEIHRSALREYVHATWGWDESWQRQYFADHFDPAKRSVIVVAGNAVGFLDVERRPDGIMLHNLEIGPAFQGRGIGSSILHGLVDEAVGHGIPIFLQVLKVNGRAQALYLRFGFVAHEKTQTHVRMFLSPGAT